jgi:hypothetical protein
MAHLTVAKFALSQHIFESTNGSPKPTSLIQTKVSNYQSAAQGFCCYCQASAGLLMAHLTFKKLH